jgi:hypothetical protein
MFFLFKSGKNNKSHLQRIVADFGVKVVPNRQMLNYFRAGLPKVKVKIKKADGVELGNVEVVFLPLFRKVGYGHAKVVECSAYEMLLLVNLNFHNEPCTGGILAIDIKHRFTVELSFAKLLSAQYAHLFNGAFEPVGEECIEEEQKEFRASLVGESFFESEIQSERRKPRKCFIINFHRKSPVRYFYDVRRKLLGKNSEIQYFANRSLHFSAFSTPAASTK